ncbi:MAG: twin-arginine translocation signal domain-containing protein, partial [Betaproteobacteria bacterium]|nr:twin-arginine translocation signal domain-containing protein [Betaproteobacteria bacterium]
MIDTQIDTAEQARVSRRGFLKAGAALSGGLMLAVCLPGTRGEAMAAGVPAATNPNAWVHIGADNTITVLSARS